MINFCLFSPPSKKINKYYTLKNSIVHAKKLFLHKCKSKKWSVNQIRRSLLKFFQQTCLNLKCSCSFDFQYLRLFLVTKWLKATLFFAFDQSDSGLTQF